MPMTENNEITIEARVYEVSFIFDNKIEETEALAKANALKDSIAALGGSFISEETPYIRELAYEMVRVQNNINVRFNVGHFGWIKFEMDPGTVPSIEKQLKSDEQVVRYIIIKTVRENTVFTKRAPIIKAENIALFVEAEEKLKEEKPAEEKPVAKEEKEEMIGGESKEGEVSKEDK